MLRPVCVLLHRFVGLAIAGFLFVSGLTGAVISWDHELDEWLNPHLNEVASRGPFRDPLALAAELATRDERALVTYVPLHPEEGHALVFGVEPRFDPAAGALYDIGYNEVFVDPVNGAIVGRREWGAAWPLARETFVSFLYVLHYSLQIPELWGIDRWGLWLMGGVALLWAFDCLVGFYLTLPVRRPARVERPPAVTRKLARGWWSRWKPAWRIKWRGSPYRLTFDMHRACSLWLWAFLFILAVSGASLNLYAEVAQPVVNFFSSFTPTPFDTRPQRPHDDLLEPKLGYTQILENGRAEARRRGIGTPAGDIFYSPDYGVFGVRFFAPGDDHGAALFRRRRRALPGRLDPLARHRRRPLPAGPVPAPLRPHRWPPRPYPDLGDGARRRHALRHRRRHLVSQEPRPPRPQAPRIARPKDVVIRDPWDSLGVPCFPNA